MSERRSNQATGQHVDNARAQDNGQATPGSAGRRTAGNLSQPGQKSGGEEHCYGPARNVTPGSDTATETFLPGQLTRGQVPHPTK
jgi:hypothetical protein